MKRNYFIFSNQDHNQGHDEDQVAPNLDNTILDERYKVVESINNGVYRAKDLLEPGEM